MFKWIKSTRQRRSHCGGAGIGYLGSVSSTIENTVANWLNCWSPTVRRIFAAHWWCQRPWRHGCGKLVNPNRKMTTWSEIQLTCWVETSEENLASCYINHSSQSRHGVSTAKCWCWDINFRNPKNTEMSGDTTRICPSSFGLFCWFWSEAKASSLWIFKRK